MWPRPGAKWWARPVPPAPPPPPAGVLFADTDITDQAVLLATLLLLALAHEIIHRARFPRGRMSWQRAKALVQWRMLRVGERRLASEPVAFNPHIAWSEPSPAYAGWTFFAAVLVALISFIFQGPFVSVRLVYTFTVSFKAQDAGRIPRTMWHVAAAIRSQSTSFPCPPPSPATQSIALLGHRLNYYARHNILLYCVDLCYWVHACGLQALWRSDAAQPGDPTAPNEWALASMLSAVGPVGGAVFMLQSPLLLHHPEVCGHACSTFPCRRAHGTRRTPGASTIGGVASFPEVVAIRNQRFDTATPRMPTTPTESRRRNGLPPLALRQDVSHPSIRFPAPNLVPTVTCPATTSPTPPLPSGIGVCFLFPARGACVGCLRRALARDARRGAAPPSDCCQHPPWLQPHLRAMGSRLPALSHRQAVHPTSRAGDAL